jgi:hypothetical protein
VPDDKLEALMAELRAIELWDRLRESPVLVNEFDRAGGLEARRIRRREIVGEIDSLVKMEIEDSNSAADGMPLSTLRADSGTRFKERSYR